MRNTAYYSVPMAQLKQTRLFHLFTQLNNTLCLATLSLDQ